MRFRPNVPAAYAPAQGATAQDDKGAVVLLFVPQWQDIIRQVRSQVPAPGVETQWAFSREMQIPIWFARWDSGHEIAITFPMEGSRELLQWWHQHGRVDVILLAEALPADSGPPSGTPAEASGQPSTGDGPASGAADKPLTGDGPPSGTPAEAPALATWLAEDGIPHLRLSQVPFMDQS